MLMFLRKYFINPDICLHPYSCMDADLVKVRTQTEVRPRWIQSQVKLEAPQNKTSRFDVQLNR